MRNHYLVSYDVSDPKRLRRTFKKLKGFGDPVQHSVFLCPLSPAERTILMDALRDVIDQQTDRVLIVNLGPMSTRGSECLEFIGRRIDLSESEAIVV
jgi:CRISPR-associated protein Cas2